MVRHVHTNVSLYAYINAGFIVYYVHISTPHSALADHGTADHGIPQTSVWAYKWAYL